MPRVYSFVFAGVRTFLLLGSLIYSCAATLPPSTMPPQNYQGAVAESPVHQPEDYWIYQRADGSTLKTRARSYPMTIDFPLWLGRTWSYSGSSLTQGQSGPSNATRVPVETTCEVAALKSISVPAGTFEAFECNCTCKVPADYFRRECGWQKLWYAPAVKNVIQVRGDSTASALDLVEYKVGDKASRSDLRQDAKPNDAGAFYSQGIDYYTKGETDRAIENYNEAIRLNPNLTGAFIARGAAYRSKGDYDRAMSDYDEAIRLNPRNYEAFNNRGNAYRIKGNYDRAIQDLNEAIRLEPNYEVAFTNRGDVYRDKKEYDHAIQDYDKAIRLKPTYARAFNNRGNVYRDKRDYDRAIQDYNQAIQLNPSYALAFNNRAIAYLAKKDFDRSLADREAAARIDPKEANYRSMSHLLFYLSRFEQSAEAAAQALKASPQNMYVIIWRYMAQVKITNLEVASRELSLNAAGLEKRDWPTPVIDYYLGKITEQEVYAAADNPDPKKKGEQICEAKFYAAEAKLLKGATEEAIPLLRAAEKECPPTFYETHGARAELKRLGY